jgi:hypothetical protein
VLAQKLIEILNEYPLDEPVKAAPQAGASSARSETEPDIILSESFSS